MAIYQPNNMMPMGASARQPMQSQQSFSGTSNNNEPAAQAGYAAASNPSKYWWQGPNKLNAQMAPNFAMQNPQPQASGESISGNNPGMQNAQQLAMQNQLAAQQLAIQQQRNASQQTNQLGDSNAPVFGSIAPASEESLKNGDYLRQFSNIPTGDNPFNILGNAGMREIRAPNAPPANQVANNSMGYQGLNPYQRPSINPPARNIGLNQMTPRIQQQPFSSASASGRTLGSAYYPSSQAAAPQRMAAMLQTIRRR